MAGGFVAAVSGAGWPLTVCIPWGRLKNMTGGEKTVGDIARAALFTVAMLILSVPPAAGKEARQLVKYEKCLLGLFYQEDTLDKASVVNGYPEHVGYDPIMTVIVKIALSKEFGVTAGHEMFFPSGRLDTRTKSGMVWLAHEMRHVAQGEAFGRSQDFLQGYATSLRDGMLSGAGREAAYMNSPFETDARAVQNAFKTLLAEDDNLTDALAGGDPDEEVCGLVDFNFSAYKSVLDRELNVRQRETHKFLIPSYPFLLPKKVIYTFYR